MEIACPYYYNKGEVGSFQFREVLEDKRFSKMDEMTRSRAGIAPVNHASRSRLSVAKGDSLNLAIVLIFSPPNAGVVSGRAIELFIEFFLHSFK